MLGYGEVGNNPEAFLLSLCDVKNDEHVTSGSGIGSLTSLRAAPHDLYLNNVSQNLGHKSQSPKACQSHVDFQRKGAY